MADFRRSGRFSLTPPFEFDFAEFQTLLAFKSVELSNGGTLTAPSSNFDVVFRKEFIDDEERQVRFTTEGRVVNEKLKPTA